MGNNSSANSGNDNCRSDLQTCATICTMTNSAPELGSSNMLDAISSANCISTTCHNRYDICNLNNRISAKGGISAGDNTINTSFNNGRPYRKQDNKVYIYQNGEIPFNGRFWNGRCYAIYVNGELRSFQDSNGNACCSDGHLGNEDTSNGGGSDD